MWANSGSRLDDRLIYALNERPSSLKISIQRHDGRWAAIYIYGADVNQPGKRIFSSADNPVRALDSLARKVHAKFHPENKNTEDEKNDQEG